MSRLATLGLGLSAVCLSLAGCRAHGASADSQCLEVDAELPADATADGLEGEYRLTFSRPQDESRSSSLCIWPWTSNLPAMASGRTANRILSSRRLRMKHLLPPKR